MNHQAGDLVKTDNAHKVESEGKKRIRLYLLFGG